MTCDALISVVVREIGRADTLFRICVENQIAGTTQTLFLVLIVVGVLGAGQASSVLEERSISGAALAHLSLGVVDLSVSTSSTSSIDDERSILRALTFVVSCIVNKGLGT